MRYPCKQFYPDILVYLCKRFYLCTQLYRFAYRRWKLHLINPSIFYARSLRIISDQPLTEVALSQYSFDNVILFFIQVTFVA